MVIWWSELYLISQISVLSWQEVMANLTSSFNLHASVDGKGWQPEQDFSCLELLLSMSWSFQIKSIILVFLEFSDKHPAKMKNWYPGERDQTIKTLTQWSSTTWNFKLNNNQEMHHHRSNYSKHWLNLMAVMLWKARRIIRKIIHIRPLAKHYIVRLKGHILLPSQVIS